MGFSRSNRIGALLIALQPDLAQGAGASTGRAWSVGLNQSGTGATGGHELVSHCLISLCEFTPLCCLYSLQCSQSISVSVLRLSIQILTCTSSLYLQVCEDTGRSLSSRTCHDLCAVQCGRGHHQETGRDEVTSQLLPLYSEQKQKVKPLLFL